MPCVAMAIPGSICEGSDRHSCRKEGKRRWLDNFLKRWPTLKVTKPRQHSMVSAKTANQSRINCYYEALKGIMDKYDFHSKLDFIFNVDNSGKHSSPCIVRPREQTVPAIVSTRINTTTVIVAGTNGRISDSGWSNKDY